jgi:hypothetical protein
MEVFDPRFRARLDKSVPDIPRQAFLNCEVSGRRCVAFVRNRQAPLPKLGSFFNFATALCASGMIFGIVVLRDRVALGVTRFSRVCCMA